MKTNGNNEQGYILIVVLLLLLVLTVIGLAALNTSSIENVLSGNIRLKERNVSKADAGVEISTAVIERAVRAEDVQGFGNIVADANLPTELRNTAFSTDGNTDVTFAVAGQNVAVDIDKMYSKYMGGSAIKFAAGYEGAGKGAGSGFYTFFRINATGADLANSTAAVGTIYRYIPK